jgi:hypothetical protein
MEAAYVPTQRCSSHARPSSLAEMSFSVAQRASCMLVGTGDWIFQYTLCVPKLWYSLVPFSRGQREYDVSVRVRMCVDAVSSTCQSGGLVVLL